MARCGCGGACACNLTAGTNTTVSGTGSAADPWVISAATDCAEVRTCFTSGGGVTVNQGTGVISACLSTDANNIMSLGTDGCLYATSTTNCAQTRACLSAGNGVNYNAATGQIAACLSANAGNNLSFGTDNCLYSTTNCTQVRNCLSGTSGVTYNPSTGAISACLSGDAGNNITLGTDGCLFVPTGAATVAATCGLLGDGSGANPLTANTATWPWPCAISTANGTDVYCDPATGRLISEPSHEFRFRSTFNEFTYADLPVPVAADTEVQPISVSTTNPSTCRTAQVVVIQESDVYFNLPPGGEIAWGQGGDEFFRFRNTGTSTFHDYHLQGMKMFSATTALAAGGTYTHNWSVNMGFGAGGATYHRIATNTRFLIQTN